MNLQPQALQSAYRHVRKKKRQLVRTFSSLWNEGELNFKLSDPPKTENEIPLL
jgi:hypothetical protein